MKKLILIMLMCILLLTACNLPLRTPKNEDSGTMSTGDLLPNDLEISDATILEPQEALTEFFLALNHGRYDQAIPLYGGSYEELQYFNPMIDADEKAELLQAGCEFNGFMCLAVLSSELMQTDDERMFIFKVQFANEDGSLFILGPCCGATEETMPPVSVFNYQVICEENGPCQVQSLPPLVP